MNRCPSGRAALDSTLQRSSSHSALARPTQGPVSPTPQPKRSWLRVSWSSLGDVLLDLSPSHPWPVISLVFKTRAYRARWRVIDRTPETLDVRIRKLDGSAFLQHEDVLVLEHVEAAGERPVAP